jgi:hypothetical protein
VVPIVATLAMAAVALLVAQHVQGKPALMAISLIGGCGATTYVAMLAVLLGGRWPRALREA